MHGVCSTSESAHHFFNTKDDDVSVGSKIWLPQILPGKCRRLSPSGSECFITRQQYQPIIQLHAMGFVSVLGGGYHLKPVKEKLDVEPKQHKKRSFGYKRSILTYMRKSLEFNGWIQPDCKNKHVFFCAFESQRVFSIIFSSTNFLCNFEQNHPSISNAAFRAKLRLRTKNAILNSSGYCIE